MSSLNITLNTTNMDRHRYKHTQRDGQTNTLITILGHPYNTGKKVVPSPMRSVGGGAYFPVLGRKLVGG